MDQRGGCCIARYAGGAYDMSKVDRIMLRFRPIAPKPASTNGSLSGGGSGGSSAVENSGISVRTGRGRRRRASKDSGDSSVKKRNGIGSRKRKAVAVSGGGKVVKTLPLMPETPEAEESNKITANLSRDRRNRRPLWLSFGGDGETEDPPASDRFDLRDPTAKEAEVERRVLVWSWVRVECVTDTCAAGWYGYGNLGRTDEEKVRSLDLDTCPAFISDGLNRVRWMNAEYRKMVAGERAVAEGEVVAWVVVEEAVKIPAAAAAAFTCRVKVVTWDKEKKARTVPCDVWRMDCGGFAWRLDTKAALSLAL